MLACILHRQHDPVHLLGKHLIRHARKGILFVDGCRNPEFDGFPQDRAADIAARSHTDVRCKFPQDVARFPAGVKHPDQRFHVPSNILQCEFALKARNHNAAKCKIGGGNQAFLHAAFCANIQYLRLRVLFAHISRNRQSRINMAGRAAARQHDLQLQTTPFFLAMSFLW